MLSIAICDVKKENCEELYHLIAAYFIQRDIKYTIETFHFGEKLLSYRNHLYAYFDIVLLNIQQIGKKAIQIARQIRAQHKKTTIILIGSLVEYTKFWQQIQDFKWILRDNIKKHFKDCMETIFHTLKIQKNKILIPIANKTVTIPIKDILYFEDSYPKTKLITVHQQYKFCQNINLLEYQLKDKEFIRIYKKFLINQIHLKKIEQDKIILTNEKLIPVNLS